MSVLLPDLLLPGHRLLRALARARVRVRPLAAHGKAAPVADALVGPDLDLAALVDELADADDLFFGEVAHLRSAVDAGPRDDLEGASLADPVDVTERDVHPLVAG